MRYVVKEAKKREREPVIKGSTFHAYLLEFESGQKVEMLQKPDTPAPKPGDALEGDITPGKEKDDGTKWPDKFTKAGQGKGGWQPRSPQETAQIVRQHSQAMALAWLALGDPTASAEGGLELGDGLKKVIDWFDADVRSVGQPNTEPVRSTTPERAGAPEIPEDRALKILDAAQDAGLAEGTKLKPALVAKLIDVGCETGKIGHLNVDQAEAVETWIANEMMGEA